MLKDIPAFSISLDFELYWGVFDKVQLEEKTTYYDNTRRVIPQMLSLFEKEKVHVTWATVGMLFAKDWEDWASAVPAVVPAYNNARLSSYRLKEKYAEDRRMNEYFFAPELVDQIRNTPYQEMATHTFSHYYCREGGQDLLQFKHDLQAARRIAARKGIELHSLVFPRNQLDEPYLKICAEEGIKTVRSNPSDWFWNMDVEEKPLKRFVRGADAYLPIGAKTSYKLSSLKLRDGQPLSIPASRLLRPVHSDNKLLNSLRLQRVLREMTLAAKAGECYHLWWHPNNFGDDPELSMADLRTIINHYKMLENKWGMTSMSMLDVYDYIKANQA
ncbi:polysaccharide deacetylase family protein [Cesiribacter sp. SM1]|uniref:polysaccharide deacetylase family protein n=1 Tax=Cesiribacter sp. SM1 TaxID=2861196 RepID=UPI001CD65960|nr:polysaccharide deacetylase family protein [Cesiribacter sp. SM1]